jgi:hypothetical protein
MAEEDDDKEHLSRLKSNRRVKAKSEVMIPSVGTFATEKINGDVASPFADNSSKLSSVETDKENK